MSIIASVSTSGIGTPFNVSPSTSSPNSSSSNNRNSVIPSNSHRASTIALEKFSRSVDHLADVLNSSDDDDALLAQRASESGVSSVTNTTVTSSSNTSSKVSSQRSRSLDSNPEPFASSSTDARGSGGQLRHSTSRSSVRSKSSVRSQGRRNREIRAQYEYYNLNPKDVPDVSAEMEKWYAMTDRYGFMADEQKILRVPNKFSEEREVSRAQKWARMAEKIRKGGEEVYQFKYSSKFIKRVFKGIPDSWRREAWYYTITNNLREAEFDDNLKRTYNDLLRVSSPHERQIDLDVPRTMHGHIMFRTRYGQGQRILFNVLRAFSNYDKEVGYCQGMTNVVAMLLTYFEEEKTFVILTHLFRRYNLHNLFIPGFPALMESFEIQERLTQKYAPKVAKAFSKVQITSSAYATRWYITLFTGGVVPNQTLLRIWDVFFLNGFNVLYYVAVALLKEHQDTLVNGDFEKIMNTLGATMEVKNDDRFMRSVRRMHAKGEAEGLIESLRKEYRKRD